MLFFDNVRETETEKYEFHKRVCVCVGAHMCLFFDQLKTWFMHTFRIRGGLGDIF